MSYIDKIKKGNTEYDIHGRDTRLPGLSDNDTDKVLGISNGQYELKDAKDFYMLKLVLDLDPGEDLDAATSLGISYHWYGTRSEFVTALNQALSSLAGTEIEVTTLMELRQIISSLDDQTLARAFLFIALIGVNLPTAKVIYEVTHVGDPEPATATNVYSVGYFDPMYVFFTNVNGQGVSLATSFTSSVGNRAFTQKTIYCDALPSDI